ncbi:MAG: hypothetical protein A2904_00725 [Candidatus Staskawiczbacteria bacterium RIFCSPLOWO2_01_FULL_33_9]|uniref:Uncharacterized protein n=1 Tax=Candidatus Staskawiczbacteria bacterium RIFCSPLOWO2_01_FULL_33_9 TaxID=1802211 RepID=A0A1G2I5Y7_9BACT|nr:MAG: hypothetical protein A2904_00725 [Candidatus Staskawiczbacteria bacterium RIFCSPLOWO2_01_FULL_33_9]
MDELKKERDRYITKIFWLGFQISFIFAIPAVIGVVVGRKIDYIFNTNNKITTFILFLTFIFSWFLVFVKYNKLNKKLKEINKTVKEHQQN